MVEEEDTNLEPLKEVVVAVELLQLEEMVMIHHLMEVEVETVEMVQDYQQLLVLMVFLLEVVDITLVVELDQETMQEQQIVVEVHQEQVLVVLVEMEQRTLEAAVEVLKYLELVDLVDQV